MKDLFQLAADTLILCSFRAWEVYTIFRKRKKAGRPLKRDEFWREYWPDLADRWIKDDKDWADAAVKRADETAKKAEEAKRKQQEEDRIRRENEEEWEKYIFRQRHSL